MEFIRKLLKSIIGTIDKEYPSPDYPGGEVDTPKDSEPLPDKGYESYKKWMGDHQYHILAGAIFLIFGVYIYLYWDDVSRLFKKDKGKDPDYSFD